jgi:hypothetical protein
MAPAAIVQQSEVDAMVKEVESALMPELTE